MRLVEVSLLTSLKCQELCVAIEVRVHARSGEGKPHAGADAGWVACWSRSRVVGMPGQRQDILVCEWHASLMVQGSVVFLEWINVILI